MESKYLKKKKLYEIAKKLSADGNFPMRKEFEYKFSRGTEWLKGKDYKIASQCRGAWIKICHYYYENYIFYEQQTIFALLKDGKYEYQSSHKTVLEDHRMEYGGIIEEIEQIQEELDHRTQVENEAIKLISELKFDEAMKLLSTI